MHHAELCVYILSYLNITYVIDIGIFSAVVNFVYLLGGKIASPVLFYIDSCTSAHFSTPSNFNSP